MIVLITSHAYTHYCTSFDLTCWSTCWYIILIILERVVFVSLFILIVVFSLILCVHWWYIWALPDCVLHDCPSSAWLHVACLCGSHFYPPTSNSLGVGHSFHLGSHYYKCETFCVLALGPIRDKYIILWIPHFCSMRSHSMAKLAFYFLKMIYWLRKWLGVATYFCFIFKGKTK